MALHRVQYDAETLMLALRKFGEAMVLVMKAYGIQGPFDIDAAIEKAIEQAMEERK